MKTKKSYNTPSIKVIEIDHTDIIATSDTARLYLDLQDIEDEGSAD